MQVPAVPSTAGALMHKFYTTNLKGSEYNFTPLNTKEL
jgi:hypothetical protein